MAGTFAKRDLDRLAELQRRQDAATEGQPTIGPRVVAGPREPTPEERAAHEVLHMPPASGVPVGKRNTEASP